MKYCGIVNCENNRGIRDANVRVFRYETYNTIFAMNWRYEHLIEIFTYILYIQNISNICCIVLAVQNMSKSGGMH